MKDEEDPMHEVNQCKKTFSSHRYAREDLKLQFLFEAAKDEEYQQIVNGFKQEARLVDLPQQHPSQRVQRCVGLSEFDR